MDPYIGEIRMFAGNFAPRGWSFCNGQTLSVTAHQILFSVIGTQYGGDGRTTFKLPDMRGRAPLHQGAGPGLTPRTIGETGGHQTISLTEAQLPAHNHVPQCTTNVGNTNETKDHVWAQTPGGRGAPSIYDTSADPSVMMNPDVIVPTGDSMPHNNMQPYLVINYIICIEGVYPPRQ